VTTAVLVHGAWHGAWCFERVIPLLRDAGIEAVALDLPGHGDHPGPLTDLHGDAALVRGMLDGIDDDVVLLGHSYGGAVITEAGVHPKVRHLVYLCAFAVDAHETCMSAAVEGSAAHDISWEGRPNLADAFLGHDDGTITITAEGAAVCFFHDCDAETAAAAIARLGPQPLITLQQEPTAVAWRERPSTYVVCSDDLGVHPGLQRLLASRCSTSVEWPTSHSPFLSAPERVAELLVATVRALDQDDGVPSPSAS
jgi:pimeloyl-ACP methyl ester carboxylesterase